MPRPQLQTTRVSLYQVEGALDPSEVLNAKYLGRSDFTVHQIQVGIRTGLFIGGSIDREEALWVEIVSKWTEDPEAAAGLGNRTAAGVLLLPTRDSSSGRLWAICFGMGFHLIESTRMIPDLGRRFVTRTANSDSLKSLTFSRLDARAYVARTSIPGGDDLNGFGADDLGDLVSRLVGPAMVGGMLAGESGEPVEIRGADSLSIPLARDSNRLLLDLDIIEDLLERDPVQGLETIELLRSLKSKDPDVVELNRALDDAIGNHEEMKLGLAWPTELADEASPVSFFRVSGFQRGKTSDGLDLDTVLNGLITLPSGERVARLDRMRVQAFSDEEDVVSSAIPARNWLSYETVLNGRRFCMHDGRWYQVDQGLDERLSIRLKAIFETDAQLPKLPEWPIEMDEQEYNQLLATNINGVCLDRKLIRCESIPRGFESCDVLTPSGDFLHVKRIGRSTGASHLFAQAGVSAQALISDDSAARELKKVVESAGGDPAWVLDRPARATLVMANDSRLISGDDLFSFSRMRLVRLADELKRQSIVLSVVPIRRTSP